MDDLYHQDILDHYYHPDNFGKLDHADQVIEETNASCGDSFTFYIKISPSQNLLRGGQNLPAGRQGASLDSSDGDSSIIQDIKFSGTGCAISTAACSLLTSHFKGKPVGEIQKLTPEFIQSLIGTQITPSRLKCLLLPARALSHLIDNT